jgi:hypothetical protein
LVVFRSPPAGPWASSDDTVSQATRRLFSRTVAGSALQPGALVRGMIFRLRVRRESGLGYFGPQFYCISASLSGAPDLMTWRLVVRAGGMSGSSLGPPASTAVHDRSKHLTPGRDPYSRHL